MGPLENLSRGPRVAKITKRFVDGLSVDDAGHIHRDDEVKGFAVRRNGDGSITYLCEYRAGRGHKARTRRMSIGGPSPVRPTPSFVRAMAATRP
jgi:hypothetical protein